MEYYIIPVTLFKQNCSLIWCKKTKETLILDPGGEEEKIHKIIKKMNLNIKKIVLTHGHVDHVGAAVSLSIYYGVPIIGPHKNDDILLKNLPQQCKEFNVDIVFPFKPNRWLQNKEKIKIGNLFFEVIHCPGHSPGHIVFWNKKNKFILMGDLIFKNSVGRTDLTGGNKIHLMNSIKNILCFPSDTIFLPGHGPMSSLKEEKNNNPFLKTFK